MFKAVHIGVPGNSYCSATGVEWFDLLETLRKVFVSDSFQNPGP
jgi:hypothetical protein